MLCMRVRLKLCGCARFDGSQNIRVPPAQVKQIAGRAGRYGSRWPGGEVTCLYDEDMDHLRMCMDAPVEPLPVRHTPGIRVSAVVMVASRRCWVCAGRWLVANAGERERVRAAFTRTEFARVVGMRGHVVCLRVSALLMATTPCRTDSRRSPC